MSLAQFKKKHYICNPLAKRHKKERMRKALLITIAVVALCCCQERIEDRAVRDAKEVTQKKCPLPMNSEGTLILERITFDKPTLTWRQDFLLDVADDVTLENFDLRGGLLTELKNTPSYKPYMDAGFNFQYVYCRMSNPKDTLINTVLTPQDYR